MNGNDEEHLKEQNLQKDGKKNWSKRARKKSIKYI